VEQAEVSRWLARFLDVSAGSHGRANSANSANRSDEGAFGTNGTIGTEVETSKQAKRPPFAPIPEPGPGAQAQLWQDWHQERLAIRQHDGNYPRAMAEALVYGEAVARWHLLHGQRTDPALCAGCGEMLSGSEMLALPDGARVHVNDEWPCLRAYGKQWRDEAIMGLARLGIMTPDER
jgi:hypothetical protein